MTIAIDARLLGADSTGDSTYWSGLVEGLSQLHDEFRLLLISTRPRPFGIPNDERIRWVQIPTVQPRWWSLVTFPLAARRLGADVIHTQYSLSPLVGRKGITTIHDVSFLIGPEWFKPKDRFLLRSTVPAACRRAARVITVSETSRGEIERLIPSAVGKVRVALLACPSWIQPIPIEQAGAFVAEKFGLRGPYALTVGTRWPRKNMQLALSACELLGPDFPHRLLVTGKSGWGTVEFGGRALATGYVPNEWLPALYGAADLYLAPSHHEGFGIPVLEAFRCGCPVLSSAGGALPEVVGDAGVIQADNTPEAWRNSIEDLLADGSKLQDLRSRGIEREKHFTWKQHAESTLRAYREVTP